MTKMLSIREVKRIAKTPLALLLAAILAFSLVPMHVTQAGAAPADAQAPTGSASLVIAMVYGGGVSEKGKVATGVASTHSFVEIYNPTDTEISLAGYALHYQGFPTPNKDNRPADGWAKIKLDPSKSIPAKHSYLINCGATADGSTLKLADADFDQVWTDAPSFVTKGAKYLLTKDFDGTVATQTVDPFTASAGSPIEGYVDMFGGGGNDAGTTDQIDGYETAPLSGSSKQKGFARNDRNIDTNNNANDFSVIAFDSPDKKPRNLASGALPAASVPTEPTTRPSLDIKSDKGYMNYLGSYWTGKTYADGGVAEIVKYNSANKKMYLVSGYFQALDIVSLADVKSGEKASLTLEKRISVSELGATYKFPCSDITSVDVNTTKGIIAIATQGAAHTDKGAIVLLDYDGNYITHYEAGVQPDMLTFTPDGNKVLSANEGEPRLGYANGAVDPQGSVSIVDLSNFNTTNGKENGSVKTIDFSNFDTQRDQLIKDGVLLKPNTAPSSDLEPEYIAINTSSTTAYVSLQEANAVATLDLAKGEWTQIRGLGFKNHNLKGNELDLNKNGEIKIQSENAYGVYMPDGLATTNIGGTQYVLTPNEGDSREWVDYADIGKSTVGGAKVDSLLNSERDGLDADKTYLYGARSFSIWNAADMKQVFDSGSGFESKTAELIPQAFNSSHSSLSVDNRSGKKGPEPEDIKTLTTTNGTFAFIGLERVGGIMMYDISDPANATYYDYINVRDLTDGKLDNGSDLGAEGLCVVDSTNSPTGKPMVLVANEISGSVTLVEVDTSNAAEKPVDPGTDPGATPGTDPGSNPGADLGTDPGTTPGTDPGTNPDADPGTEPGTTPGTDPIKYPITTPAATWTGTGAAKITIDAPLDKFVRLFLGGNVVDPSNYTLSAGSTIITFSESYLKTLSNGTYIFKAEFTDGTAEITLPIQKASAGASTPTNQTPSDGSQDTLPKTGDNNTLLLGMLIVMAIMGVVIALAGISHRKKSARKMIFAHSRRLK